MNQLVIRIRNELHADSDVVYLLMKKDAGFALAYSVTFPPKGDPVVRDRRGDPLPASVATRFKARRAAIEAVTEKLFAGATYNFEVLNDPDGSGFLVYALAATTNPDEPILGGHFRIYVSEDGSKVGRIDSLSTGIMRMKADPGQEVVGFGTSQLVSNVPVETFLYSSHVYKLPIGVAMEDGSVWQVANGKIHKFTKAELAATGKAKKEK